MNAVLFPRMILNMELEKYVALDFLEPNYPKEMVSCLSLLILNNYNRLQFIINHSIQSIKILVLVTIK